jgi:phosphoribosyl 1,2-cyclic phosphate phosphodiesterase
MKITLLGTGTSTGIPAIGCRCPVCRSDDIRNNRLRPSVWIESEEQSILIDTTPDFRQQALRYGIGWLDAILFTHHHADHILGLDDIRPLNHIRKGPIPCYGSADTLREIRLTFRYVFQQQPYGGVPQVELNTVERPFRLGDLTVTPVPALHGRLPVFGYRLGDFAYLTDLNSLPEKSLGLLDGLQVLVIGALRYEPHPAHFTLTEAVGVAGIIGASRTYFTHMSHEVDHETVSRQLPSGIELAYDGLTITL